MFIREQVLVKRDINTPFLFFNRVTEKKFVARMTREIGYLVIMRLYIIYFPKLDETNYWILFITSF